MRIPRLSFPSDIPPLSFPSEIPSPWGEGLEIAKAKAKNYLIKKTEKLVAQEAKKFVGKDKGILKQAIKEKFKNEKAGEPCKKCQEAEKEREAEKKRKEIVKNARNHVGKDDWAKSKAKDGFSENSWKCNLFAHDVIKESGIDPPRTAGYGIFHEKWPTSAQQWGDPKYSLEDWGWKVVDTPQPGDIISDGGHVAIVSGDRTSISAAETAVVENDWGFRDGQKIVIRRYVDQ